MKKKLIFWNSEITGTTLKHLKKSTLQEHLVLIPDNKTLEKFNSICEAIQLKIESLSRGIENLAKIKNDLHKMIFSQKIEII